ncbi:MAG: error-prone DNA polymerase, partial [Myxococcota bacterium]
MTDTYVELGASSAFSFLHASSLPEDLVTRAAALGHFAIALSDRDTLAGAPRFFKAAREAGIKPIVGAEVDGTRLLVTNRTGYQSLCRLLSEKHVQGLDTLEEHHEGLIALTRDAAALDRLVGVLGPDSVFATLERHLDADEERENLRLLDAARRHRVRAVAANGVRHATPDGRKLADAFTCLRARTTLDAAGRLLSRNAERHLKSPAEMARLFRDRPDALYAAAEIADRCAFTLADLGYRFPDYPAPPGETALSYLHALTYAGARDRYRPLTPKAAAQIDRELALITKLDLAGYFLIVWDIVRFCREQGILAQGRGSAANSAVCYALGITAVDPVGMDLLFERFLSEERFEWPDIDLDLPSGDRREEVIQHVYRRYGPRGAAMTATVVSYRGRMAVREMGKVLGLDPSRLDRLARLIGPFEFATDEAGLAAQAREVGLDASDRRVRLLVELCAAVQGLPRHLSQHPGGMVVAAGRLDAIVPLQPAAMPGRVIIQWDKDDCSDLGILKIDLLGLGMLAVLEEAVPLIRAHEGVEIDLAHLPSDDAKTYAMIRAADTVGVFQIESRAQMATLPRMKPERFYDLVIEVAIIRPGPVVGKMVHPYLARRAGREPVSYPHPSLEPILARTLGVPLFQEQIMRMAMVAGGFSGGQAEELRRAMGFRRSRVRMETLVTELRAGMTRNGIGAAAQEEIVQSIRAFALYGFPESHAASFALIAYASAYLKAHHPAAFYTALLNQWPMGFYHPATLVKDAERHGVTVLPACVLASRWTCAIVQGGTFPAPPRRAKLVEPPL